MKQIVVLKQTIHALINTAMLVITKLNVQFVEKQVKVKEHYPIVIVKFNFIIKLNFNNS